MHGVLLKRHQDSYAEEYPMTTLIRTDHPVDFLFKLFYEGIAAQETAGWSDPTLNGVRLLLGRVCVWSCSADPQPGFSLQVYSPSRLSSQPWDQCEMSQPRWGFLNLEADGPSATIITVGSDDTEIAEYLQRVPERLDRLLANWTRIDLSEQGLDFLRLDAWDLVPAGNDREMVRLYCWEGKGADEVGTELHIVPGWVRGRISELRKKYGDPVVPMKGPRPGSGKEIEP
jgi:hypothetical protein